MCLRGQGIVVGASPATATGHVWFTQRLRDTRDTVFCLLACEANNLSQ